MEVLILTIVTGVPDALLQEGTASSPLGDGPGHRQVVERACAPSRARGGEVPHRPLLSPLAGRQGYGDTQAVRNRLLNVAHKL